MCRNIWDQPNHFFIFLYRISILIQMDITQKCNFADLSCNAIDISKEKQTVLQISISTCGGLKVSSLWRSWAVFIALGEANDQVYLWNWSHLSSSGATLWILSGQMGNLSRVQLKWNANEPFAFRKNNTMIKGRKRGWKWICHISHVLALCAYFNLWFVL